MASNLEGSVRSNFEESQTVGSIASPSVENETSGSPKPQPVSLTSTVCKKIKYKLFTDDNIELVEHRHRAICLIELILFSICFFILCCTSPTKSVTDHKPSQNCTSTAFISSGNTINYATDLYGTNINGSCAIYTTTLAADAAMISGVFTASTCETISTSGTIFNTGSIPTTGSADNTDIVTPDSAGSTVDTSTSSRLYDRCTSASSMITETPPHP